MRNHLALSLSEPRSGTLLRARRRSERGMAVFIVMLAITLLTGLGIWASRSASLVDIASGNSRQALQSQYIADLGIEATSAFMADNRGDEFIKIAAANQYSSNPVTCTQNKDAANAFCHWFDPAELQAAFGSAHLIAPASSATPGEASLGPFVQSAELTGDFIVEMTDKGPAVPPPGTEVGDVNPITQVSVVLTAFGTVRPVSTASAGECDPLGASISGRQTLQATTIVSPVFK